MPSRMRSQKHAISRGRLTPIRTCFREERNRAARLGRYPSFFARSRILVRVVALMPGRSCSARSTVPMETPSERAISRIPAGRARGREIFARGMRTPYHRAARGRRCRGRGVGPAPGTGSMQKVLDSQGSRDYVAVNVHGQDGTVHAPTNHLELPGLGANRPHGAALALDARTLKGCGTRGAKMRRVSAVALHLR